jgi:adenylate kinase
MLGRQGSGKGTQAARLAVLYGAPHISTGDAFRAAARNGTEVGRLAQSYMDRGELVPDDLVMEVLGEHLLQGKAEPAGFVLDGVPRNIVQAEALAVMLGPKGLDVVINLDVSTEVVLRRIAGRRVCTSCGANYNVVDNPPKVPGTCDVCGGELVQRDDDTEDAVKRRLEIYESVTAPLVDWYKTQGLLATVDAAGDADEVTERVVEAVEAARQRKAVGD